VTLLWWIVVGICVVAVLLLVILLGRLFGYLRRLHRQSAMVMSVAQDAGELSARAQDLNTKITELNDRVAAIKEPRETSPA
jgi:hypothetical protein